MDASTELMIVFGIVSIFAVVGFFELKFMRSRREQKQEAFQQKDDAHNAITTAKAVSLALQGQKRNTSEADMLIYQAESAYARCEYLSCIELAGRAKDVLKNSKEEELLYCPPEKVGEGTEKCVPAFQAVKKLPPNYLEAKFILESVTDSIEQLGDARPEDVAADLREAQEAFDKEDYTESLRSAMKAKRRLEPAKKTGIPATGKNNNEKRSVVKETESNVLMRSCPDCGAPVNEKDEFCFSCGARVDEKLCPTCSTAIVDGDRFCRKCGTKV